jgi:hypothetical protein
MPYFVKIGPMPRNKSGVGSRGFHIYRRGANVRCVWGAVEVRPGRQFFWAHTTQHRIWRCASVAAAVRKTRLLSDERVRKDGYARLPVGARILRHSKSLLSTRRV